jgi:hypothetical protein
MREGLGIISEIGDRCSRNMGSRRCFSNEQSDYCRFDEACWAQRNIRRKAFSFVGMNIH